MSQLEQYPPAIYFPEYFPFANTQPYTTIETDTPTGLIPTLDDYLPERSSIQVLPDEGRPRSRGLQETFLALDAETRLSSLPTIEIDVQTPTFTAAFQPIDFGIPSMNIPNLVVPSGTIWTPMMPTDINITAPYDPIEQTIANDNARPDYYDVINDPYDRTDYFT